MPPHQPHKVTISLVVGLDGYDALMEDVKAAIRARPDLVDWARAEFRALGDDLLTRPEIVEGRVVLRPSARFLEFRNRLLARAAVVM